jgi:aspartyl-tRNA(Asn)/glutamyl-tRNA(Gln) amidotransferase subunit C
MQIDDKLITHLEDISSLVLSDDEKINMKENLQKIIDSIIHITGLNTDDVPESIQPFNHVNVLRDDEVLPSYKRELILQNAMIKNNEMFIAPKAIE